MKTVAMIAGFSHNFKGNFIASLLNLELRLDKDNVRMVYLFPDDAKQCEWFDEMRNSGKKVYAFPKSKLKTIKLIWSVIKEHNIKILHTHFWYSTMIVASLKFLTLGKLKVILHYHSTASGLPLQINNKIRRLLKENLDRFRGRVGSFFTDMICGCGEVVYEDLLLHFERRKCCFVENKIDFNRFDTARSDGKSKYGFEDNIVCMIFGDDFYRKGCDIAIKALYHIASKYRIKLIIIAKESLHGRLSSAIIKIAEENGMLSDWIKILSTTEKIGEYYKMSDILLAPSREEGFLYAIPEAIYCGCFPIRSNLPAMDRGLPYDMVVPCEDCTALKEKVEYIITNLLGTEKLTKMLSENKEYVVKNFSIDSWSEEIYTMYKRFL